MDIAYAKDAMGGDIVPEAVFISGFVRCEIKHPLLHRDPAHTNRSCSHPKDFTCTFRPRSESARQLIVQMADLPS